MFPRRAASSQASSSVRDLRETDIRVSWPRRTITPLPRGQSELGTSQSKRMLANENGSMDEFFSGRRLYGDNFSPAEIEAWHRDEQSAYFELATQAREAGFYDYHALNWLHGYRHLPPGSLGRVMSFGGASGE